MGNALIFPSYPLRRETPVRSGLEGVAPLQVGVRCNWQPFVNGLGHFGFVKMSKRIEIPIQLLPASAFSAAAAAHRSKSFPG